MVILIDNGHGIKTVVNQSPDGRLKEYVYCREIAKRLVERLTAAGYDARRIVTEDNDVSLSERCRRINAVCKKVGAKNCVSISIHLNAACSDGKWHTARGFSVYVSKNASSSSKALAKIFTETATGMNLMGNRCIPANKYWVQNLAMCRDTNCPAVLTENLFQDNKEDMSYLMSEEGKNAIVNLHFEALCKYMNNKAS